MLDDANHFGPGKFFPEHVMDGFLSMQGFIHHLVVDGVLGIEPGQRIGIAGIEGLNPLLYQFPWLHMVSFFVFG